MAAASWEGRKDGNGKKGVHEQAAARALCREYIIFAKLAGNPWSRGCSSLSESVCEEDRGFIRREPTNQFSSSIKYLARFIAGVEAGCRKPVDLREVAVAQSLVAVLLQ